MKTELLGAIGGGGGARVVALPNEGDKVTTEVPSLIGAWQAGKVSAPTYQDTVSGARVFGQENNYGGTDGGRNLSDMGVADLRLADAGHTVTMTKRSTSKNQPGGGVHVIIVPL